MLYLTKSAISEELDVVSQTEVLHLHCRSLVNQRVLNLQDRHAEDTFNTSKGEEREIMSVYKHVKGSYLVAGDADASVSDLHHSLCVKVSESELACRQRTRGHRIYTNMFFLLC